MKVIFLDVDGVLIHDESLDGINLHIDEEKIKILKEIVEKTDSKIVLSSAWRKEYNRDLPGKRNRYKVLENILNRNGLQIYDRTPIIKENNGFYQKYGENLKIKIICDEKIENNEIKVDYFKRKPKMEIPLRLKCPKLKPLNHYN